MKRWWWLIAVTLAVTAVLGGAWYADRSRKRAGCRSCHAQLEDVSPNHSGCVSCHAGTAAATSKEVAHEQMLGPRNPAQPQYWQDSCGRCHPFQLRRMQANLMFTNSGFIRNIRLTWEGGEQGVYATAAAETFAADGTPLHLLPVASLDNLAGELYRKYCSLCHVGIESRQSWRASHAAGCAACHFPFNADATYQGRDLTVRGKWPYSASHRMEALPGDDVCLHCHNRSGRIALSYRGWNDGNNGAVPVRQAFPANMISGGRNISHIQADIHQRRGMECIDCHTSRDVMGDGYAYGNMYQQTEISCEDCHGSGAEAPRHKVLRREHAAPLREGRSYRRGAVNGDVMVLTAKGRPYSNVYYRDGRVVLVGKRDGREHISKVITGSAVHRIAGHGRLECYACHSAAVPQCFGCHTSYDKTQLGIDYIRNEMTPGRFAEREDYRRVYPFPLALDQRGKIAPVTPGCQTFVTVVDETGTTVRREDVSRFRAKKQLRFAPIYSHNSSTAVPGCSECHANPQFLGFGQGGVRGRSIEATLLCEQGDDLPLDGYMVMRAGRIESFAAVVREHSRPLNAAEVRRVLAVNQCLVCHDDAKDPVYQRPLDYARLDACLRRAGDDGCQRRAVSGD